MPLSAFLDKLAQLRANNCENLPTPELAILTRTVARLRREGLQGKCLQVGETVPDFSLRRIAVMKCDSASCLSVVRLC